MPNKTTLKLDGLEKLQRNLKKLEGSQQVSSDELMTDSFIRSNTRFDTWQQMMDAGGVQSSEDIEGPEFSRFIAENSQFADFQAMCEAAGAEYVSKKLFS